LFAFTNFLAGGYLVGHFGILFRLHESLPESSE
jgi:hypothetical protein